MSGLIGDLFVPPSQQSDAPLLGPIIGGGEDATTAPADPRTTLPAGTPSEASSAPAATGDAVTDAQRPGESQGPADGDAASQQPSPTQALPSLPPTRPRPTFIITASAAAPEEPSASLPAPLSPSALPSLPSTPDADDVLIVAPPLTSALVFPTAGVLPPTTLMTLPLSSALSTAPSSTPTPGDAEASLSGQEQQQQQQGSPSGAMASLMPALPISLGIGGGVLLFGVVGGLLYKKGVWPFRGDRQRDAGFEEIEDGVAGGGPSAAEKRFQQKWDPRVSGVGVFTTRTNGATNF